MKKTVFLLVLFFSSTAFAGAIYTEPEFATENDSIIVYFDATQAERQELVGYTGDLYTHTGVTTNLGEWQHVIEGWGNNNTQPKLTRIDTDLYKLAIGYPREFYNTDSNEEIISLNFVFRSADATKQTENIFYTLFDEGGITAIIDSPAVNIKFGNMLRSPLFYEIGETIGFKVKVAAIGSEVDSITIYKNGQMVKAVQGSDAIKYSEIINESGDYYYTVIAKGTEGLTDTTHFAGVVKSEIIDEPLPAGAEPGVIFTDDGGAVISIFAPYKEFIYLIGSYNDWMVDNDYLMKRYYVSEDSVMYWHKIENITQGQVYQYQFLIDGDLRVADPYAQLVLDPWNDQYIDDEIFPDMPQYPTGKTEQIVSTFIKNSNNFQWSDEAFVKPDKEELVIYEMLVRDFVEEHSFSAVLEKLDYLDSLGINAIELMPVNEFEGNLSWGYNPSFYFAVDKYYGSPGDLKMLVNECHKRGIAVIGDLVLNHSYDQSPLARMYWNSDDYKPAANNPWYNEDHNFENPSAQWGNDFNHESPHTQYFVDRVNRYWIEEFYFDGYRFDFTKGFTNTSFPPSGTNSWGSNYDISRINNLKRMTNTIWSVDSNAYVIFEHLSVNDEEKELADHGILLWGNMNHSYNEASMGYDSDLSWGYYETRGWNKPNLVTYMESHDEERLMVKNLAYGNSAGDYDIQHLYTALQRQKLVNAFFLTLPGPKMIWQFGELGYDLSINWPSNQSKDRLTAKPTAWELNYYDDANRRNLYKTMRALLKLRENHEVFTSKNTLVNMNVDGTIKTIKMTGSPNVLIVGNFGVNTADITLNFVHGGNWYDFFSGDTIEVNGSSIEKTLEPGEFHIYSDRKFFVPQSDLLVGTDREDALADEFKLLPAYPNPFNPETNIVFTIPEAGDVQIRIYNILGEIVSDNTYRQLNSGYHTMTWNTTTLDNISSGIYIIQAEFENKIQNSRVLLIK